MRQLRTWLINQFCYFFTTHKFVVILRMVYGFGFVTSHLNSLLQPSPILMPMVQPRCPQRSHRKPWVIYGSDV